MSFNLPQNTPISPPAAPQAAPQGYIRYAPEEPCPEPEAFLSLRFVIFAVVMIGGATAGGLIQSGKIPLNGLSKIPAAVAALATHPLQAGKASPAGPAAQPLQAVSAVIHRVVAAAPTATPVPPLKPDAFVVTSISMGQPSIAIINGTSRVEGDPVEAPGVTGWKVSRIVDGAVVFQNGSALATVLLSTPGLNPLNDQLHPLN